MNRIIYPVILYFACSAQMAMAADDVAMSASLADKNWNGKTIPEGQQCLKFSGKGETPRIRVEKIPDGANALVVEYSDKTYKPMDNGGHGKIGYYIDERMKEVTIPSVQGQTFELPKSFFIVSAHKAPTWDREGAYLPPCSGGKGNLYSAKISAVKVISGTIEKYFAATDIELGVY